MYTQKNRRRYEAKTAITPQTVLKNCFFSLLISAALALLLSAVATAVLLKTGDPGRYQGAVGVALCYLVSFLCGGIATRLSGRRVPLLCGAATGAMLLLLTLAFLPFGAQGNGGTVLSFSLHALLLPVCMGGALLAAHRKSAPRIKRLRR